MPINVLLVDDVKFFLELEKNYLKNIDCAIYTATNGREALELALKIAPDVIFLDYEMPEMNGLDFLQAFSQNAVFQKSSVVIVSSFVNNDLEQTLLVSGAKEIIKKPFSENHFLTVATRYMNLEKRKKERISINLPAFFGFEDEMEKGTILDFSEGGLFLAAERLLKQGAYLELKFMLPEENESIKMWCRVAWLNTPKEKKKSKYPDGMGLQFVDVSKEILYKIAKFIERVKDGHTFS